MRRTMCIPMWDSIFFTQFLLSVILNSRPYFNGVGYRHRFTLRGSRTSERPIAF
jgi:hypothetical protein